MKYTFEKGKKSTVKVTMKLTAEEWGAAINGAYEKTKGRYSVPGFRKGKAPKKVLESAYGAGIFYEEAINQAFPKYYGEVLDKEPTIKAVAAPEIDVKNISEKGITLIAIVPVRPDVTLGEYKGINYKKPVYNVKDEDVEEELKRLQERNSRMVEVTDREVKDGDTVVIDYSGSVDGVKFEGGTAEKQPLTIGSNTFIPGFEEQVVGMKLGEERDINVKFPEEYHAENLKGKDAVFAIKLHEIKVKELPEINDEFIKDAVGAESVEAYKSETKARLEKQNSDRAERELEDEIIKKITEGTDVEIPDALIENQIDRMVQEMEYRMSYQGLRLEDYLKYVGKSIEDFRKDYESQATELVKSQLVIEEIIEREEIVATDEDVEARVNEMAEAQGKKAPDVKKNMNARQLDYIKNEIVIKKFFDYLKSANTIE
ncbi:MAG: trigger factor [Clostridia bacterium]|nr:trigger factor [Clostridia bacterium]